MPYPAVANVAPHVLREVGEYRIDTAHVVEELGIRVVRLYLCRHFIQLYRNGVTIIQALYEFSCEARPIHLRSRNDMRVVISRSARKLHKNLRSFELF